MDLIPFLAPLRSGAPLAKDNVAPEAAASTGGLTDALAAFMTVLTGRMPVPEGDSAGPNGKGDDSQSDAVHLAFADLQTSENDGIDGGSPTPFPAAPAAPTPAITDRPDLELAPPVQSTPRAARPKPDARPSAPELPVAETRDPAFPVPLRAELAPKIDGGISAPGATPSESPGSVPHRSPQGGRPEAGPNAVPNPSALPPHWSQETGGAKVTVALAGQPGGDERVINATTSHMPPSAQMAGQDPAPRQEVGGQPDRSLFTWPGMAARIVSPGAAEAAMPAPDALRNALPDGAGEQMTLRPGQATGLAGPVEGEFPAMKPVADREMPKPAPDRPILIRMPVTKADVPRGIEGAAPVAALSEPDVTGQAPAVAPATVPAAPVPLAVLEPTAASMIDPDGAHPDEVAGLAAGGDTVTFPRTEHRAALATQALPPGLGQRLAETVARFPDRPVEVTLSPEELGRVRMSLSTHDGTLTMSVQADRPETLDLLRRNIDQLAQDFRDLGYRDLSFSFGDRPARQSPAQGSQEEASENAPGTPQDSHSRQPQPMAAPGMAGGLDLRL